MKTNFQGVCVPNRYAAPFLDALTQDKYLAGEILPTEACFRSMENVASTMRIALQFSQSLLCKLLGSEKTSPSADVFQGPCVRKYFPCQMLILVTFPPPERRTTMTTKPIDLHVHSTRSDGTYTPTQLVDYAIEKGLAAFALTDHDSVAGLDEAISYAENLQATNPDVPEVIPGIEFSTEYQGKDIHIVGLYIDYHSGAFKAHIDNFVNSRDLRNEKMCRLLRKGTGMDISYEKLQEAFPDSVITRAHYAKYMLEHGYIKSLKEAFERYVGDHCPYYVPREKVTPAQAIQLILAAGGIPVLAHPTLYGMGQERLNTLVAELKQAGLIALEAIYSTYTPGEERDMRTLAAKHHLAISGGSDFHGSNKPGLDLGVGYGKLYVPYEVLSNLIKSSPVPGEPQKEAVH